MSNDCQETIGNDGVRTKANSLANTFQACQLLDQHYLDLYDKRSRANRPSRHRLDVRCCGLLYDPYRRGMCTASPCGKRDRRVNM